MAFHLTQAAGNLRTSNVGVPVRAALVQAGAAGVVLAALQVGHIFLSEIGFSLNAGTLQRKGEGLGAALLEVSAPA
jgi:hypothetical protein